MSTILGIIVLILDIVAIVDAVKNTALDQTKKILWILLIVLLPLIGMILYFILGKNKKS